MRSRFRTLAPVTVLFTLLALLLPTGAVTTAAAAAPGPLPVVTPRPQEMSRIGADVHVPSRVRLVISDGVDRPTRDLVAAVLRRAGASRIQDGPGPKLTVAVGRIADPRVARALRAAGGRVPGPLPAEGYALAAGHGSVALAGADSDGTYYAAQTLRQLVSGHRTIASVSVTDHPLMPLRGVIEGFYGSPWTHAERMDQLAFYGDVKMNTYIYAPKDDPYHREKWREPYPAAKLAELGELVRQATDHHVRFTFAVSPGNSICYSDPTDLAALEAKLDAVHDLGVRSFSMPLDDISYTRWNCESDRAAYGDPSSETAAKAQSDLLNTVQKTFLDERADTRPLQMVPTEYGDVTDTPYKRVLRERLDSRVEVMWTGTDVVPPRITVADAERAATVWGRKVFVWDNYPVNDYGQAEGRLLLAPYDAREPGLHRQLSGLVLNPMNQAAASKVALFGGADFAWNDTGYDATRAWEAAARHLAGDGLGAHPGRTAATVRSLLAFFDTQHLAPTFGAEPWQPQAPELAARLDRFHAAWDAGRERAALRELGPYARLLAAAPERIRAGAADRGFVADCAPWLDALSLWGRAFERTLDALGARLDGHDAQATRWFAEAAADARRAGEIRTIPGETRPEGPVRIADGVLDTFITEAAEGA
ncbi:beta-N-acetylglucosaminidase domain-containing protein [Streptomyces rapamycinicus]|uniref:Hyaluronidase n=2 Tax=Streptomyces rapamycinicus TaxID=1226757 RepID=A0A0A0NT55_STRRN|nr:beta-N-acetylglucosaminidase domain-containing protein [Streptomyces rapamycinicus]AGP60691.1 Hyaluronidase [Streptomyces rapamycinicus NRRL 5491]MBB4788144.1 hyaluronoglucosaminidase [Streptomyces rapamycinicus]RLV72479.1 hyaluronidase [Streptomyces rapamycinicus NRRL 5491]UTP36233.1 beta-N-acetylglucosaminidase domain-containing protein [Streptomyces rapamycinicus NRRL 5491]